MGIDTFVNNIKSVAEILKDEDFSRLYLTVSPAQPWNALTSDDIKLLVEETFLTLNKAIDNELLNTIPFSLLNAINTNLSTFNQQLKGINTLQISQLTTQHHGVLNQLQAVDTHLRSSGLHSILKLGPDIERKQALIDSQMETTSKVALELESLTTQVRTLLDPAVAGALSNAFDVRRKSVAKQKWFWFGMLIVSGVVSVWLSIDITNFITKVFREAEVTSTNVGFVWFIRLLLLVPAYFFVAFSVGQFLRERHYEENYAHKSSIAQTLPSYSELIASSEVKDEITSSASRVVFTPPYTNKEQKGKKGLVSSDIKELADVFNIFKTTKAD